MCTSFMHQCFDTVGWVSRRNWVMMCWCRYLSGASCRLFAYGPVDATVPPNAIVSCTLVLPFWYRLTQVFLEKRPLNGCSSSSNVLACRFNPVFLFFLSAVIVILYLVISWLFLVISYVWNVKISVMLEFALNLLNLCIAFHFSLLSCGHCPHLVMSVYRHGLRLSVPSIDGSSDGVAAFPQPGRRRQVSIVGAWTQQRAGSVSAVIRRGSTQICFI